MLLKLFICFTGIFTSYLLNGIAIESITNEFGEKIFEFYFIMVLIPAMFNLLLAKLIIITVKGRKSEKDLESHDHLTKSAITPQKYYIVCALMNMGSLICSNGSLAHISYPTQLILKSSKPIPILLCNCLLPTKKYANTRFVSIAIIVIGVMSFMYEQYSLKQNSMKTQKIMENGNLFLGWFLVFCSLTFDGFLASLQERMRTSYVNYTFDLMYYINFYSCLLIAIPAVLSNNIYIFYTYLLIHPTVFIYILMLGLTSAVGQTFIYFTIIEFGPLTCSVITTTRKFVNILLSVVLFSHVMSVRLWFSVVIVFIGLGLDIWIPYQNKVGN